MDNGGDGTASRFVGLALFAVGTLLLLLGFGKSGAAEFSDTLNIGLLNDKTNLVIAGGLIAVCGSVLFGAGCIVGAIAKSARGALR